MKLFAELNNEKPEKALSDGEQSLTFENFAELMRGLNEPLRKITGRKTELAVCV